tara:strand:- start:251 stop:613 length:363 start_codon:yes stop_codon:yes gene_type:complete
MEGARSMRIDQRSMDNEQELWDKPVATREEMASVIPDWAAGLMLEGERRDEYESERADEQARAKHRWPGLGLELQNRDLAPESSLHALTLTTQPAPSPSPSPDAELPPRGWSRLGGDVRR